MDNVTIQYGIKTINDAVFKSCVNLKSIIVPNSVSTINEYTFLGCSSLISVTLPAGLSSIGPSSFEFCTALTSIEIPSKVTSIGSFAFANCLLLENVIFHGTKSPSCSGSIFSNTKVTSVQVTQNYLDIRFCNYTIVFVNELTKLDDCF